MANCGQACPYNTLDGCKVKEHNAICPLTNMATPITECKMTNADRIRAMSDEELAETLVRYDGVYDVYRTDGEGAHYDWVAAVNEELEWLQQPCEEGE